MARDRLASGGGQQQMVVVAHQAVGVAKDVQALDHGTEGGQEASSVTFVQEDALTCVPGYAPAHQFSGNYLVIHGDPIAGLAEFKKDEELDPLSMIISAGIGCTLYRSTKGAQTSGLCPSR